VTKKRGIRGPEEEKRKQRRTKAPKSRLERWEVTGYKKSGPIGRGVRKGCKNNWKRGIRLLVHSGKDDNSKRRGGRGMRGDAKSGVGGRGTEEGPKWKNKKKERTSSRGDTKGKDPAREKKGWKRDFLMARKTAPCRENIATPRKLRRDGGV